MGGAAAEPFAAATNEKPPTKPMATAIKNIRFRDIAMSNFPIPCPRAAHCCAWPG